MNEQINKLDLSNRDLANSDDIEVIKLINQPFYNSICLSNNNIENMELNIIPDNYTEVDLSHNIISNISLDNIRRKKIDLSNNSIKELIIRDLVCETLNLSNNNILDIRIIDSKINFLDLNTNNIKTVTFINTSVCELDLSVNKIEYFDSYPKDIETMSLFANKLYGLAKMPNTIKKIDLSNNKITDINYIPSELVGLDISYNAIQSIDVNILPDTLAYLDLSHNKIQDTNIFNFLGIEKCIYDKNMENKKFIKSIEISDDSEEWNDVDEDIDVNALIDTDSEESSKSSSEEIDLVTYIKNLKNETFEKVSSELNDDYIKDEIVDDDDEISKILKEYKGKKENEEKDNLKNTMIEIEQEPLFEKFHLQWNIVI